MEDKRDIKTISFGAACRERIGMYLSADRFEALHLGLREIYVNSLDALLETDAKVGEITISINTKDREVRVADTGPGIPNKVREDGTQSVIAAFTLAHTGSHFDGRKVSAIGSNGMGGSIVNHTAQKFMVQSNDSNTTFTAIFAADQEGAHLKSQNETKATGHSGLIVQYTPDPLIYGDEWFDKEYLTEQIREMMKFYPRYTIQLNFDNTKTKIAYPNGLKSKDTKVYYESDSLIIALGIGDGSIRAYGNRLFLPDGGDFFTHFKTQLTKNINSYSGLSLKGPQILNVFNGYLCIMVSQPLFSNQAKTKISNKEVNAEISTALKQELQKFVKSPEWQKVVKELEAEMKAEEAAERARAKIKKAMDNIKKGAKRNPKLADKLKDCLASGEDAWLAITEGDSAQGAINSGRDINHVATFPIRGKFINCLKNPMDKYLENEELQQILSLLGCGMNNDYNPKKLKYGKVLIAVDADEDGKNILDLLITFFYVCLPQFVKEGRLYWMKAPLYMKDHKYIFTEEDWKKVANKTGFKRAKGLGEMTAQEVSESLFGEQKNWIQLQPNNWANFSTLVEDLMGKDVETRRNYIFSKVDFERIKFL